MVIFAFFGYLFSLLSDKVLVLRWVKKPRAIGSEVIEASVDNIFIGLLISLIVYPIHMGFMQTDSNDLNWNGLKETFHNKWTWQS